MKAYGFSIASNYLIKLIRGLYIFAIAFSLLSCSEEVVLCPDESHPHAIDLGLPNGTKWACCNVGAPLPQETGGFYSWGETQVKSCYDRVNYLHGELSNRIPQRMGDIAGSEYDVAKVRNGPIWEMPTSNQWQELIDYSKWKWVKYKGHHGWMVTGPNGNSIFLPAGGERYGETEWHDKDERGAYWASNLNTEEKPFEFRFHDGMHEVRVIDRFDPGFNIRPIVAQ